MEDVSKKLLEVVSFSEGRDEERADVVAFLRDEADMAGGDGEILRLAADLIESAAHKPDSTSQQRFIEEMRLAIDRSATKAVFGYRNLADASESINKVTAAGQHYDRSVVAVLETMGILAIDDIDAPVTKEGGKRSTPLYELDQPHRWPKGLWKKLVKLVWVIDRPINPLDVIARRV